MTAPLKQADATVSSVTASATSVQLFAAKAAAQRFVYNDSTANLRLKFGTAASATSFTVLIPPAGFFEFPGQCFDNVVHGVWETADGGAARLTEVSD
jgi:hypothetical protein